MGLCRWATECSADLRVRGGIKSYLCYFCTVQSWTNCSTCLSYLNGENNIELIRLGNEINELMYTYEVPSLANCVVDTWCSLFKRSLKCYTIYFLSCSANTRSRALDLGAVFFLPHCCILSIMLTNSLWVFFCLFKKFWLYKTSEAICLIFL